jgi:hypothetical protein
MGWLSLRRVLTNPSPTGDFMAFTLRITISGLCLFVPTADRLHVLMPATTGGTKHAARLVYDIAYEAPGSSAPEYEFAAPSLLGSVLTFDPPSSGQDVLTLPEDPVISLTTQWQRKVFRSHLMGSVPSNRARIELLRGKAIDYGARALFDVTGGTEQQCRSSTVTKHGTRAVVWGVEATGVSLDLKAVWPGKPAEVPDHLYPRDDVLDITIAHAVPTELPPKPTRPTPPKRCEAARHFHAFYALTDRPNPPHPVPRWQEALSRKAVTQPPGQVGKFGIVPVTCLIAQAEPI